MNKKFKKRNKNKHEIVESSDHYTKFKKVELVATGSIVMCRAITIDGVEEIYDWNRQSKRDIVKNNCIPNVEIIISPSVPANKGWNYGRN